MTNYADLIISLCLFIFIIIINFIIIKKKSITYKSKLYQKTSNLVKFLYLITFLLFVISLIINLTINGNNPSTKATITYIVNSLSIAILCLPVSLQNLYRINFKDEEKFSHIKTIVTNIIDKKYLKKFTKAGINLIILSKENTDIKINTINEEEINKKALTKNILIKTDNPKIIEKYINKEDTLYEFNNLNIPYEKIKKARGVHDNYIRTIKYLMITYLPLILSYFCLSLLGFPTIYNLLLVILLKIFTMLTSNFLYRHLPYDKDIMERKVKDKNILFGKQELFLTIIISFFIFFAITLPYMSSLSQGGSIQLANTLFILVFIYSNLFLTFSTLSDSPLIINIIKSYKNIRLIIFLIICILLIVIFNFTTYFNTRNIYLHNNISCILFGLISIIIIEITKLARFTSLKGKKKNESKNNKKYKRS